MGIPKFYKWLSERYPLTNQPFKDNAPEIDNFYLDMNGIIHQCSHGNDTKRKVILDEILKKMFFVVNKFVHLVKPRKILYIAVDGVAPRAKMNQQRARRFRTAYDKKVMLEKALEKGEDIKDYSDFDSNCISPGTEFMQELGEKIKDFMSQKIQEDIQWQQPTIIFSGHDCPGEGEHKIMEYIRGWKNSPLYTPNTRHCVYGLDADLLMLSLVSHEERVCLLREIVSYQGGGKGQPIRQAIENPSENTFILFQIGVLREYLQYEFMDVEVKFEKNFEGLIDDFILFNMLVGNDFLPALPSMDISEGALDRIFQDYKQILPILDGYITNVNDKENIINIDRLMLLLERLSHNEYETLANRASDAQYMQDKKQRRNRNNDQAIEQNGNDTQDEQNGQKQKKAPKNEGPTMMNRSMREIFQNADLSEAQIIQKFKEKYYEIKMQINDSQGRLSVVQHYIDGLFWVMRYYYYGIASWEWYYPFHYAPMASDMFENQRNIQVPNFQFGKPFLPFQQLLGILPSASQQLLPACFRWLMTDEQQSPIIDYYPLKYDVDQEGKRSDWEGVVLIPFIQQDRLLGAYDQASQNKLTQKENQRNSLGQRVVYSFQKDQRQVHRIFERPIIEKSDLFLTSIKPTNLQNVQEQPIWPSLINELSIGVHHTTPLLDCYQVNMFGNPSKKESLGLILKRDIYYPSKETQGQKKLHGKQLAEYVSKEYISKRVYVKYPFMVEAIVQAVSNKNITFNGPSQTQKIVHTQQQSDEFELQLEAAYEEFQSKYALIAEDCSVLVHVKTAKMQEYYFEGGYFRTIYDDEIQKVPLELVFRHPDHKKPFNPNTTVGSDRLAKHFLPGQDIVFLHQAFYGCVGKILEIHRDEKKVNTRKPSKPSSSVKILTKANTQNSEEDQESNNSNTKINNDGQTESKQLTMVSHKYDVNILVPSTLQNDLIKDGKRQLQVTHIQYMSPTSCAEKVGISLQVLQRLTGSFFVRLDGQRYDIGLAIKSVTKKQIVPSYTRPQAGNSQKLQVEYSRKALKILQEYKEKHEWVIEMIKNNIKGEYEDINAYEYVKANFPSLVSKEQRQGKITDIVNWIKKSDLGNRRLVSVESIYADEVAIQTLEKRVQKQIEKGYINSQQASIYYNEVGLEQVPSKFILGPLENTQGLTQLEWQNFQVGDRVINVSNLGQPPFGYQGFVVGVYNEGIDVLFDHPFEGGTTLRGSCQENRGMLLEFKHLLNATKPYHGQPIVKASEVEGIVIHDANCVDAEAKNAVQNFRQLYQQKIDSSPTIPLREYGSPREAVASLKDTNGENPEPGTQPQNPAQEANQIQFDDTSQILKTLQSSKDLPQYGKLSYGKLQNKNNFDKKNLDLNPNEVKEVLMALQSSNAQKATNQDQEATTQLLNKLSQQNLGPKKAQYNLNQKLAQADNTKQRSKPQQYQKSKVHINQNQEYQNNYANYKYLPYQQYPQQYRYQNYNSWEYNNAAYYQGFRNYNYDPYTQEQVSNYYGYPIDYRQAYNSIKTHQRYKDSAGQKHAKEHPKQQQQTKNGALYDRYKSKKQSYNNQ